MTSRELWQKIETATAWGWEAEVVPKEWRLTEYAEPNKEFSNCRFGTPTHRRIRVRIIREADWRKMRKESHEEETSMGTQTYKGRWPRIACSSGT